MVLFFLFSSSFLVFSFADSVFRISISAHLSEYLFEMCCLPFPFEITSFVKHKMLSLSNKDKNLREENQGDVIDFLITNFNLSFSERHVAVFRKVFPAQLEFGYL